MFTLIRISSWHSLWYAVFLAIAGTIDCIVAPFPPTCQDTSQGMVAAILPSYHPIAIHAKFEECKRVQYPPTGAATPVQLGASLHDEAFHNSWPLEPLPQL